MINEYNNSRAIPKLIMLFIKSFKIDLIIIHLRFLLINDKCYMILHGLVKRTKFFYFFSIVIIMLCLFAICIKVSK